MAIKRVMQASGEKRLIALEKSFSTKYFFDALFTALFLP
jgi:hypothetical protein